VYLRQKPPKRPVSALLVSLAAAALATGCGGGGGSNATLETQHVQGTGFGFAAPAEWRVTRGARSATVKPDTGSALVSVTVLALRKRYRPALFARAAAELDRVTGKLAARLDGKVIASRTLVVGGIRSRQYDLAYSRAGSGLIDRITYVLHGTSEYYLLCRWPTDEGEPAACAVLAASFRIR
jgi:hypothetical protein